MKNIKSATDKAHSLYTGNLSVFNPRIPPKKPVPVPGATDTSTQGRKAKPPIGTAGYAKIATAVVLALTAGAILGGAYTASGIKTDIAASEEAPSPLAEVVPEVAVVAPAQRTEPETVSQSPDDAETLSELEEIQRLGDLYQDEINWLESQNASLKDEVDMLNAETAEINRELLDLELAVLATRSKPKAPVAKRTVYNFVDVPVGGNVETATQQNNIDSRSRSEVIPNANNNPDSVANQLIYDPHTGFYTNTQYDGGDDGSGNSRARGIEFPPINDNSDPQ